MSFTDKKRCIMIIQVEIDGILVFNMKFQNQFFVQNQVEVEDPNFENFLWSLTYGRA